MLKNLGELTRPSPTPRFINISIVSKSKLTFDLTSPQHNILCKYLKLNLLRTILANLSFDILENALSKSICKN